MNHQGHQEHKGFRSLDADTKLIVSFMITGLRSFQWPMKQTGV
jgi:hypothetical protein